MELARAPRGTFGNVRGLLFDVDDTLTTHGELHADAYASLWRARAAGLWLCAVTGRGAGWCDMMVRLWPVHAVVGETGAFAYEKAADGRVSETFLRDAPTRARDVARRDRAVAAVARAVKGARLSRDSAFRLCDVAFDLVEDGPPVPDRDAIRIQDLLRQAGLTVARSSVHINTWVGDYDKRGMVDRLLKQRFGPRVAARADAWAYAGDSRNDGPLFARFPLSVGVANVRGVLPELQDRGLAPRYITRAAAGGGFVELVARILRERRAA